MEIQPDDVLVCPACGSELFMPIYRLAQPRNSPEPYKQAKAYWCVGCKGSFPTNECRAKREAGRILMPR